MYLTSMLTHEDRDTACKGSTGVVVSGICVMCVTAERHRTCDDEVADASSWILEMHRHSGTGSGGFGSR